MNDRGAHRAKDPAPAHPEAHLPDVAAAPEAPRPNAATDRPDDPAARSNVSTERSDAAPDAAPDAARSDAAAARSNVSTERSDAAADAAPFVHPTAVVDPGAVLGVGVKIWHFCHVMSGAVIGEGTSLGQNCFVAAGVHVGARVKVQNNVSLYEGVELADEVFVGPSAVFTNVMNPRARVPRRDEYRRTRVGRGATIGANATLLPGVTLGEHCFVGAGALVRRDVPAYALVGGVPARQLGWMSRHGERLEFDAEGLAVCPATGERYRLVEGRVELA